MALPEGSFFRLQQCCLVVRSQPGLPRCALFTHREEASVEVLLGLTLEVLVDLQLASVLFLQNAKPAELYERGLIDEDPTEDLPFDLYIYNRRVERLSLLGQGQ